MKEKTCFFTGHRNIHKKDYDNIYFLTKNIIEFLIKEKGITYFKIGGAREFDTIASLSIIELKKIYPNIKIILVLPCKSQPLKWCEKDKQLYSIVLQNADEIIYTSENYIKNCMLKRNDKLIEDSSYCISYLKENIKRGGTFYTVRRAIKNNIQVYNINNYL